MAPIHVRGKVWPARRSLQASCAARDEPGWHPHRSPGEGCRCGIYATKGLEQLSRQAYVATEITAVVGSVALWGTVVEHERGYRSEFAYPDRLRFICPGCLYLFTDGVPSVVGKLEDGSLVAVCVEHLPVLRASSRNRLVPGVLPDAGPVQEELLATYAVDLLPLAILDRARLRARAMCESPPT